MKLPSWWPFAALGALALGAGGVAVASKGKDGSGTGDGGAGDDGGGGGVAEKTGGKLSKYFTRGELDPYFEASGKQLENLKTLALTVLDPLREAAGVPLSITPQGGYNGPSIDAARKAKGRALRSSTSQHRAGKAGDVRKPAGWTYDQWVVFVIARAADGTLPSSTGIGIYSASDGFIHLDTGGRRGSKIQDGVKHF